MIHHRVPTVVLVALLPLVAGCLVRRPANPRYGVTWNWSNYSEWERFVRQQDGLTSHAARSLETGLGLQYEHRFSNWSAGLFGRHNQHRLTQNYLNGGGIEQTDATVNAWYAGPFVARNLNPTNWLDVQLTGGPVIKVNTGVFKFLDALGVLVEQEQRTHVGTAWQFGTSVNLGPWNNWGITAGYRWTDSFRADADNNGTIHFGLWFDHVRIARNTPAPGTATHPPGGTRPPPGDSTPPVAPPAGPTPRPPGDTTVAPPPRPPADTTIAPPRPPRDSTPPSAPPPPIPPSRPDSQDHVPSCCGFRGRDITYPRLTDGRQPPSIQAAAWSPAVAASNVLLPNGAFFHMVQDLVVESVGFPFDWTRHYLSDLETTAGGMIGHRWDFTLDKRVLPLGGSAAGEGLVQEHPGQQSSVMYFNGQGRAEIYSERRSSHRPVISNFGTGFSAWVTIYASPPGAFHEIERYVLYRPEEHPFRTHVNVDAANGEAIFYVLREKNGLRYVFNCRGQLIHILSRHDFTSLGAVHPDAERDSVRVTIEYDAPLNPLTQSPMPVRIRDTANRTYGVSTRNIGTALLETNYGGRPQRGAAPIPRIWRLTSADVGIEYVYRPGVSEAILDEVRVNTGSIATTTRYAYDAEHRLLRLTPPKQAAKASNDSAAHENTYDGSGRVTRQVLGGGLLTWTLSYEGTDRATAVNAASDQREYQLRRVGPYFVTSVETLRSGPSGLGTWVTRYEHNQSTQVTRLTLPRGNVVRYEYDNANGAVTLGRIRDFDRGTTYDNDLSLGNLLAVIQEPGSIPVPDPVSITKRYEFEPLFNQVTKETDARGSVTEYSYRYLDKGELGNAVRMQGPALTQPDGSRQAQAPVTYTYNKKGQIATIIDQRRGQTRFTYGGDAWYVKQVEFPGGAVKTYDVDAAGRVREEGGTAGTTRYRFDLRGRVVTRDVVVGENAVNSTHFEYDLHNQVVRTRTDVRDNFPGSFDVGGQSVTIPTAQSTQLVASTDYDLLDRPVREVVGGIERRYEYDNRGHVSAIITPSPTGSGETRLEFQYDARGLVTRRMPGFDNAAFTTFGYDANMNLRWQQAGFTGNRVVTWEHDPFDREISQEDGRETSLHRELDPNGNVLRESVVGSSGDPQRTGPVVLAETEYRYNELNRTIVVRRHLLDRARTVDEGRAYHTGAGDLARLVNAAGEEKRFEYDVAGRATLVAGPDVTTRTTYTPGGLPAIVVESETEHSLVPNSRSTAVRQVHTTTRFAYDVAGRLTQQSAPGAELRLFYNSLGQVRGQYESGLGLTETRYDALGQRIEVRRADASERTEYLASGHVARVVTAASDRRFRYDDHGRLVETRDEKTGAASTSRWTSEGDEAETRDANGTTLRREFDEHGMVTRLDITYGTSHVNDNGFDRTTLYGPAWETFSYDGLGRPVRVSTELRVSTQLAYDGLGRVVAEVQERDGVAYRVERSYAANQSWSEVRYPTQLGGIRARHERSPSGAVQQVEVNGREIARFQYAGGDRLTSRRFVNGVLASYDYDAARRIREVQVTGPGTAGQLARWWTTTLTYRGEQVTGVVDRRQTQVGAPLSIATTSNTYDAAGRRIGSTTTQRRPVPGAPDVVSVSGTYTRYTGALADAVAEYLLAGDQVVMARHDAFTHDAALRVTGTISGARLAIAPAQGGAAVRDIGAVATLVQDDLTAVVGQQFRYDRAGNLIADSAFIYTYDHANRLTRVTERDPRSTRESMYFVYDGFGRRVYMTPDREHEPTGFLNWAPWARQSVAFVYDGAHVIGELEGGTRLLARYVMGARAGDRIRMDRRQNDEPDGPLVTYYLHENVQGALGLASDSTGRQHWIDYAPASGATSFRAPNDLHTIGGSGTRSPYLAGTTRVDGFSGVRYDEVTRERVHDYRENRALAARADAHAMTQQMHAFTAASLASMAAVAASGIVVAGLPALPGLIYASGPGVLKVMAATGVISVGAGFATAEWMGTEYSFGMALRDFGEGALMGALGGAMVKTGASLGAIAAADYATGFWSGFLRANPTESVSDAAIEGVMGGAFGAAMGLGIGSAGKLARGEQLSLTDWRRARQWTYLVPASPLRTPRGLNARYQTVEGEGIIHTEGQAYRGKSTFTIFADREATSRELALERTILSYLRDGTRASRLVAALILKGELKIRFRETSASRAGAEGSFIVGTDYITININASGHRIGNPARQIAATIVHEGIHYLGGGELAAWYAHTRFLMKQAVGHSAIPSLRYLAGRQALHPGSAQEVAMTRRGIAVLAKFIDLAHPDDWWGVNPIHASVIRAKGMGTLLGMTKDEIDFAQAWLRNKGAFNSLGVPRFTY